MTKPNKTKQEKEAWHVKKQNVLFTTVQCDNHPYTVSKRPCHTEKERELGCGNGRKGVKQRVEAYLLLGLDSNGLCCAS